jgi:hypothetical protein
VPLAASSHGIPDEGNIMGKLAKATARRGAAGPVQTTGEPALTAEGAAGWSRDVKSELFLLAITNMVGEQTFYEQSCDRDSRFVQLLHQAVAADPAWVARLIPWLRTDANMRTASIVAAAEYARAVQNLDRDTRAAAPTVRSVIGGALQRADEPGEFCAYWTAGRRNATLPGGVQRGVADAAARLYDERAALKYDGLSNTWRLADVLEVAHPKPAGQWQADLFTYLLDRRHHGDGTPAGTLPMLRARGRLDAIPAAERADTLRSWGANAFSFLADAGMTWEALSGWLGGPMDAVAWQAMIPSMGLMALARNLRNFDEAGVSDSLAQQVAARFADAEQVRRSRMFPLRFLSAYKAAPSDRWRWPLEQAVQHSLSNVPKLPGRTLILIDCSGSMQDTLSGRSSLMRSEAAALFGLAVATRSDYADVVRYGSHWEAVKLTAGGSLLRQVADAGRPDMGGTDTFGALAAVYRAGFHDRVVILTDEQAHTPGYPAYMGYGYSHTRSAQDVLRGITKPVVTFNLAGYQAAHAESGPGRVTVGGLSDAGFRMLALLDARSRGDWPF